MASSRTPGLAPDIRDGLAALGRGDAATAFALLDPAFARGDGHAAYGLALAARRLANFERCLAAAETVLQREPGHIDGHILKADALTGLGRRRAAAGFYAAALRLAGQARQVPPALAPELARAQRACQDAQALFEQQMRAHLGRAGAEGGGRSRMEQAVDIMFGRRQVYLQKPQKFFFPELPHVQFYDPAAFEWAARIEAGKDEIKAELTALLAGPDRFEAYVKHNPIAPVSFDEGLYESRSWSAFHLYRDGEEVVENAARCPRTLAILAAAPIARAPGKSPNILFSRLAPGAHIPPHHGQMNTRLLCHLPLIAPEGCFLRVGNQQRTAVEGEMMIFDDSIEHEARNTSGQSRIVLIFDIWRPELGDDEKALVCAICEAIAELE